MFDLLLQTCNESVTSIQGGVVSSPGYDEIICTTYAGKYISVYIIKVMSVGCVVILFSPVVYFRLKNRTITTVKLIIGT